MDALPDGSDRLLVVNHAERESVEMFEIGEGELTWRGCVQASSESYLNDVAGTPDGGLVVSVMASQEVLADVDAMFSGQDTGGHVLHWTPGTDIEELPGTNLPGPNGIQVDPQGRHVYFAVYTGREVVKYDLREQEVVDQAELNMAPDNMSVGADGELYMVGFTTLEGARACVETALEDCDGPFLIEEVDPDTFEVSSTEVQGLEEVNSATVAVPVGDRFLVSSTADNRILSLPRA
ncbi:SMP-30/gluconolactonase/LRE family protein [Nocardiopsis sp. CT-R113]|uniref:SMP-30/gluconolactonase/LRE family protein n=1 Tax=Nocardiopsis codii TaxID=3065942 RepID=A0ABU7KF78_9ACTN|nr:SMP-30/gluconolactonase/LRE family protein [Nocardiopsis sp. CT-R113]MEE2040895.1 SMP-30/gluconolactonase/LRE family protein [Nocardiopsis sp. CT-R113]